MSVLHRLDRSSILVIGEYKWTILNWFPSMRRPAIEQLVKGFKEGNQFETLLGVTGSGKTFTMANVIQALNKLTLIISHNKTLAGQLYGEMKEFFPENAVEYFVSYYDIIKFSVLFRPEKPCFMRVFGIG